MQTVSVFIGQELPNGPFFDNLSFLCKFRIIYQRFDQELSLFVNSLTYTINELKIILILATPRKMEVFVLFGKQVIKWGGGHN